jgi:hypothetical protein
VEAITHSVESEGPIFADLAQETGLDFVHFNGMTGKYYYPEMMGGGGAMLDYDGDGDLDLYLIQGSLMGPEEDLDDALFPPRHSPPFADRLYRNDSLTGDATPQVFRLVDTTPADSIPPTGYGMGIAIGDTDNNGSPDLYRSAFGSNQLLRNRGDGTFSDETEGAGVDDPRWSVAAVFFDYDRDGWLDLYVGNYLDFNLGTHKICRDAAGAQDYCGPTAYNGVSDRLFHNLGNGSFEDVSAISGIGTKKGKTLGALAVDLTDDGWLDLYVANDGEPNYLWINQGDGRFVEEALWRGCAVNAEGLPQASMGVDVGDFENDGDLDLFMTHLTGEANALFRNDGAGSFTEIAGATGLAVASWPLTSFGTHWIDFDNDGWLDILTLSGAVKKIEVLAQAGDPYPLHQRKQLYRNTGNGRFDEIGARAGEVFELSGVGRGAAFGDMDNDGDVDVLVFNSNGPARLLINEIGSLEPWIGFQGTPGAGLLAIDADAARQAHRFATDGSYASANDSRVILGAGFAAEGVRYQKIRGDGKKTVLQGLAPRHYYTLPGVPE